MLSGVLGCALAHEEVVRDFIPPWLNGKHSLNFLFTNYDVCYILTLCVCVCVSVPEYADSAIDEYLRIYNTLDKIIALTKSTVDEPAPLSALDELQKTLGGRDPAVVFLMAKS